MKISPKVKNLFFQIAAILVLVAAVTHSFNVMVAKYMMIVGAAGFAASVFTTPYPGKDIRGKRLFNIQIFAVILMIVSAYLMFVDISGWVVLLFISALLTLYCSIILPRVYKKEQEEDKS